MQHCTELCKPALQACEATRDLIAAACTLGLQPLSRTSCQSRASPAVTAGLVSLQCCSCKQSAQGVTGNTVPPAHTYNIWRVLFQDRRSQSMVGAHLGSLKPMLLHTHTTYGTCYSLSRLKGIKKQLFNLQLKKLQFQKENVNNILNMPCA